MSAHAYLAPSAAGRWMLCPGSVEASAHYPDTSGFAAQRGTLMHAHAERILRDEDRAALEPLDEDEQHIVDQFVAFAKSMVGGEAFGVETRVSLPHISPALWGTADLYVWHMKDRVLTVADFKTGRVPVSPVANWQLLIYAEGVLRTGASDSYVQRVQLAVVQPRNQTTVRLWALDAVEFQRYMDRLRDGAGDATAESAVRIPGARQCQYCPARYDCHERMGDTTHSLADIFDPDDMAGGDAALLAKAKTLRGELRRVEKAAADGNVDGVRSRGYHREAWTKDGAAWFEAEYGSRAFVDGKRLSPKAAIATLGLDPESIAGRISRTWRTLDQTISYERGDA